MYCRTSRTRGFTLIELLVVIAIIALLVSILMPSLQVAKEMAKDVVGRSNQKSVSQAVYLYAQDFEDMIPFTRQEYRPFTPPLTWAIRIGRIPDVYWIKPYNMRYVDSTYVNALKIVLGGYIDYMYSDEQADAFECPAMNDQVNPKQLGQGAGWECHFTINSAVSPDYDFLPGEPEGTSDGSLPFNGKAVRLTDVRSGAVLMGDGDLHAAWPGAPTTGVDTTYSVDRNGLSYAANVDPIPGARHGPWTHQMWLSKWNRNYPCNFPGHPGGRANLCYMGGYVQSVKNINIKDWLIK